MGTVIAIRKDQPPIDAKAHFDQMRSEMVRAFNLWLTTQPAANDVALEIEATANQLASLAMLDQSNG
jgi:hypothetical protein